ncbi:hypothetical protein H4R19_003710, partial [Coemansia spiralis]
MSASPGQSGAAQQQQGRRPAEEAPVGSEAVDGASRRAFDSMAQYLQAELEATVGDLGLLETLNSASIEKYEGLSRQAQDMLVHAYKIKQT